MHSSVTGKMNSTYTVTLYFVTGELSSEYVFSRTFAALRLTLSHIPRTSVWVYDSGARKGDEVTSLVHVIINLSPRMALIDGASCQWRSDLIFLKMWLSNFDANEMRAFFVEPADPIRFSSMTSTVSSIARLLYMNDIHFHFHFRWSFVMPLLLSFIRLFIDAFRSFWAICKTPSTPGIHQLIYFWVRCSK